MKYVRNSSNITSKIEDEIIMVDVERGEYFALNPVATRIWEILAKPHSPEEISSRLQEEYEINTSDCDQEVREFIDHCLSLGIVETSS